MKKKILSILLVSMLTVSLSGCIKIIKTGEEAMLTGAVAFNAGDNVANFWESTALPEMEEKAVDLEELLIALDGDMTAKAGESYAKYSMGDSGELTYTVKGIGTISEVVTDKKAGYICLSLEGYTGDATIKIQIGTVFKGTSIRDALNFIDFNDYTNQIEWAEVSQSINTLIQNNVINPIGYEAFGIGKKVEFLGAFTVKASDEVLITPTKLLIK